MDAIGGFTGFLFLLLGLGLLFGWIPILATGIRRRRRERGKGGALILCGCIWGVAMLCAGVDLRVLRESTPIGTECKGAAGAASRR